MVMGNIYYLIVKVRVEEYFQKQLNMEMDFGRLV